MDEEANSVEIIALQKLEIEKLKQTVAEYEGCILALRASNQWCREKIQELWVVDRKRKRKREKTLQKAKKGKVCLDAAQSIFYNQLYQNKNLPPSTTKFTVTPTYITNPLFAIKKYLLKVQHITNGHLVVWCPICQEAEYKHYGSLPYCISHTDTVCLTRYNFPDQKVDLWGFTSGLALEQTFFVCNAE